MIKQFIAFAVQQSSKRCKGRAACAVLLALGAHLPAAAGDRAPIRVPDAAFAQVGDGVHVRSLTLGPFWDWNWEHRLPGGLLTARTDVEAGRWRTSGCECDRSFVRRRGRGRQRDLALVSQRLSQVFHGVQFRRLVAVGRSFGAVRQHQVSLRVQHFSNAGIKKPNPGENFVQLRHAWRFEQ
jgi:lipid A 3-O-deacylase